jgi:hypothetical protein
MKRYVISAVLFSFLKRAFAFVLLAFSAFALAQVPAIKSGSTVYIEPANGFEIYLTGALIKYMVPLVVVTDKDKADYTIRSNTRQIQQAGGGVFGSIMGGSATPSTWLEVSATFSVIDPQSSQVVFAYSTSKSRSYKAAAEKCADQLAYYMKGPKTHKSRQK